MEQKINEIMHVMNSIEYGFRDENNKNIIYDEEKWRNERKLKEKQEVKKFFSLGLLESIWIDKIKYTKVPSGWIASIERSQSSDDGQLSVAVAAAICFIPEVPSVQPILAGEK